MEKRVLELLGLNGEAKKATDDGSGTGAITGPGMLKFVSVDCDADANHIVTLPEPKPGRIVILAIGATGCELRTTAPATVAIGGGTGAAVESALAASSMAVLFCATATTWMGFTMASDGTLAQVDAAG